MLVAFQTLNGRTLNLTCNLPQFLTGPVLSRLAAIRRHGDPADLVRDHLPEIVDEQDDDELAQAMGEACLLASCVEPAGCPEPVPFAEVTRVEIEPDDLPAVRRLLRGADPVPQFAA